MKPAVLIKDKDFQKPLNELGFCVCELFCKDQIGKLKDLYAHLLDENKTSSLHSSHDSNAAWSNLVSNEIFKSITPALKDAFENYEFFIAQFVESAAQKEVKFKLQQDWNILDERHYASYQLWIPLEISYPENGGAFVLPGSHKFFENYRSGSYGVPQVDVADCLRPFVTDMIIAPGQALVYYNSLFHGFYSNQSLKTEISIVASIRQKDAPLYYFQKNANLGKTEKYPITPSSFLDALPALVENQLPDSFKNPVLSEINLITNTEISANELLQKFKLAFDEDEDSFEPTQLHILKDRELEKKLQRDGYFVFDFIDENTIREIKAEYINKFNERASESGRFTVMENASAASKLQMHHFIVDRIKQNIDQYFIDYQIPIASYFTKYAKSSGGLTWHNDASLLLNTHLEPHYGLWCPLVDVTAQNGAFCLVEKSHKFSHSVFCNGIDWPYTRYLSDFDAKKKIVDLKAGQAVFFDLRLIHNATPNDSDEDRICFCVRLTHLKTKYFCFNNKLGHNNVMNVFEEAPDFYLNEEWNSDNQNYSLSKKIGEMQNIYSKMDYAKIEAILASADCLK